MLANRLSIVALALLFVFVAAAGVQLWGEELAPPEEPQVAPASKDAEQAKSGLRVPAGLKVELFAAEPMVANPVAFAFDPRGRIYVCETFRQKSGIEDNRNHGEWLDEDLAAQTVADRIAYVRRHLKEKANDFTKQDDRIRLLEDTDGDGKADKASVFAKGFNHLEEGTGAGVLIHRDNVYYTNIPNLWRLRDTSGAGQANERQVLHTGYGVRYAFRGHDMHGLCLGPDGRLYYSIGDRGLNVKTPEGKQLVNANSGAVLRCELDGSHLEMFATGLRNPQELAFDDFGNLFTGDNNSDSGDQARWVYVAEAGDSGWRMEYQYLPDRGPFNREKIWHPPHPGQPAYIVPPIANLASGPSGLAYYPGVGLPDHFRGRFFLVDFRGTPSNSGVRTFRLKSKGAGFEVVDAEETFWSILATDVDFGPDGGVYVADWVNGWNGDGKGRIYRYFSPEIAASPLVKEVQRLLAEGFEKRSPEELSTLLGHADRRIRQQVQFALAEKNEVAALTKAAQTGANLLGRLHGIWGMWQIARREKADQRASLVAPLAALLGDSEAEVRAQAAKVLGDLESGESWETLVKLLKDESPRVRYFAASGLGRLKRSEAIAPLLALLEENADADPYLRHAAIVGLAGAAPSAEAIVSAAVKHPSAAARLGAVVALRRQGAEQVADFLDDADPLVVVEAARAIHDLPLPNSLAKLASLTTRGGNDDALPRRALNANFRIGSLECAQAVAAYAARADAPDALRLEALAMLQTWEKPSPKDRVLNFWRPLPERPGDLGAAALKANLPGLFRGSPKVQAEAAKVAAQLGIKEVGPTLRSLVAEKSQPVAVRADSLLALVALKDSQAAETVASALKDEAAAVRAAARSALAQLKPADALGPLEDAVLRGERLERQSALATLATLTQPGVNSILSKALDKLLTGEFPADARLDLVEAAGKRAAGEIKAKLAKYDGQKAVGDPLTKLYSDCLEGGDWERGRKIFLERTEVSCVRCHRVDGKGGDVGPNLSKIAAEPEKTRQYLLESLIVPDKAIAKGFESVVIQDSDGKVHTGVLKLENDQRLDLMTAEGKIISIAKNAIEARKPGKSAMPDDLVKKLTKMDVRDLVEFLASLKTEGSTLGHP